MYVQKVIHSSSDDERIDEDRRNMHNPVQMHEERTNP